MKTAVIHSVVLGTNFVLGLPRVVILIHPGSLFNRGGFEASIFKAKAR